jgi:cobalt-zinc-cadmium efflux system protein
MGPRFLIGIVLNFIFVVVEFGYGIQINSLSLIADAWHNLGDVAGLIISLFAFRMAAKQPTKK